MSNLFFINEYGIYILCAYSFSFFILISLFLININKLNQMKKKYLQISSDERDS